MGLTGMSRWLERFSLGWKRSWLRASGRAGATRAYHVSAKAENALGAREGTSAVEFALLAPVMLAILVALVDFGLAVRDKIQIEAAVRAGMEFAKARPTDTAGIEQAVIGAAGGVANMTVGTLQQCRCPGGTTIVCGDTCSGSTAWEYLTITATVSFNMMLPYPGITHPYTFSAQSTLRTQ